MSLTKTYSTKLEFLQAEYARLSTSQASLLKLIEEVEISEAVYNSNAIENSTLSLSDTEKVLIDMELGKNISIRELYEAKNLAKVIYHLSQKDILPELTLDMITFLHGILLNSINDDFAGRIRKNGEFVRVGSHIAPPPQKLNQLLINLISNYNNQTKELDHPISRIAKFHLEFEMIHPFCDGNGRIGRVLINYQLQRLRLPPIIIRDSIKKIYYQGFEEYRSNNSLKTTEKILSLSLMESFHKRIAYLNGNTIIKLSEYIKSKKLSAPLTTNQARTQNIPAFREKGIWKIGIN